MLPKQLKTTLTRLQFYGILFWLMLDRLHVFHCVAVQFPGEGARIIALCWTCQRGDEVILLLRSELRAIVHWA